jgi:hypothetical protein
MHLITHNKKWFISGKEKSKAAVQSVVTSLQPQPKGRRKEKFGGARRGKMVISPIHLTLLAT